VAGQLAGCVDEGPAAGVLQIGNGLHGQASSDHARLGGRQERNHRQQ
jgi:hypothetical protein